MTLKIPDVQVLLGRTDQIPRVQREGEPGLNAGKVAISVQDDFAARERKVNEGTRSADLRMQEEQEERKRRERKSKKGSKKKQFGGQGQRKHIDLKA